MVNQSSGIHKDALSGFKGLNGDHTMGTPGGHGV